ncbi:hypothetical protein GCM10009574_080840 [Streptomyces asiaticus]|uniref:Transposase n=2 Tax=Streptomyces rhizosphaericus TaxID=114699 RepID=A0ABN1SJZ9_9ACTN
MQEIRTGQHSAFVMHMHAVFVTKFRHNVFTDFTRCEWRRSRGRPADFEYELAAFNATFRCG